MTDIKIIEARTRDADLISQIISQHLDSILVLPESEDVSIFLDSISPIAIAAHLESDEYWYLLADLDGKTAGTIGMRRPNHLFHLFVAKDALGRGLSRRLFEAAINRAIQETDIRKITVNATPNAQQVYSHFGFKPTAPVAVKHGVAFIPMELCLPRDS